MYYKALQMWDYVAIDPLCMLVDGVRQQFVNKQPLNWDLFVMERFPVYQGALFVFKGQITSLQEWPFLSKRSSYTREAAQRDFMVMAVQMKRLRREIRLTTYHSIENSSSFLIAAILH
jgi:hypothetical protein